MKPFINADVEETKVLSGPKFPKKQFAQSNLPMFPYQHMNSPIGYPYTNLRKIYIA